MLGMKVKRSEKRAKLNYPESLVLFRTDVRG